MSDQTKYASDKKICQRYGVSRMTINRWRRRGKFPAPDFKHNNRNFTDYERLDAFDETLRETA